MDTATAALRATHLGENCYRERREQSGRGVHYNQLIVGPPATLRPHQNFGVGFVPKTSRKWLAEPTRQEQTRLTRLPKGMKTKLEAEPSAV